MKAGDLIFRNCWGALKITAKVVNNNHRLLENEKIINQIEKKRTKQEPSDALAKLLYQMTLQSCESIFFQSSAFSTSLLSVYMSYQSIKKVEFLLLTIQPNNFFQFVHFQCIAQQIYLYSKHIEKYFVKWGKKKEWIRIVTLEHI